jgi:hypothetical protein
MVAYIIVRIIVYAVNVQKYMFYKVISVIEHTTGIILFRPIIIIIHK